jgi:hypothetical protein
MNQRTTEWIQDMNHHGIEVFMQEWLFSVLTFVQMKS